MSETHRARTPEYMAAWHQKTKEARRIKRNAYKRAYYHRHKTREGEKRKANRLKSLYDLTREAWAQLVRHQNGVCAICKRAWGRVPHVDHCHTTGRVRGLLCRPCNLLLGNAEDQPEVLRSAADYLETG